MDFEVKKMGFWGFWWCYHFHKTRLILLGYSELFQKLTVSLSQRTHFSFKSFIQGSLYIYISGIFLTKFVFPEKLFFYFDDFDRA